MKSRRMFSSEVVRTDDFLELDKKTQNLYFYYGMTADDDGFINAPKRILRECGASEKELNELIQKEYIYLFPSGVILIRHWKINNKIRPDRYTPTTQKKEMKQVTLNEESVYVFNCKKEGITDGVPNGIPCNIPDGVHSIGKDSLGKDSLGKDSLGKEKEIKHTYGEFNHVLLTDTQYEELEKNYGNTLSEHIKILDEYIEQSGKTYNNYSVVLKNWVHEKYLKIHQNQSDKPMQLDKKFYEQKEKKSPEDIKAETKRLQEMMVNGTLLNNGNQ